MLEGLKRNGIVLIVIAAAFYVGFTFSPQADITAQQSVTLSELGSAFSGVYEAVSPSVVSIVIDEEVNNRFFGVSGGSGFVVDKNGHIATNYHVVEGADRIVVNFLDGLIVEARLIGFDPDADIAVLHVEVPAERLVPVTFGDSEALRIGQFTLAIGSPFSQRWTLTHGVVSALDRSIEGLAGFNTGAVIQTDTAINPGNSGGPLLNLAGEVVGVNTQIISERQANSGVGFAVPSNLVSRVVTELIQNGKVRYSYLGISGDDVDLNYINALNLPNDTRGVVVTLVRSGEPADIGGLLNPAFGDVNGQRSIQNADVIIEVDGESIFGFATLIGYLSINTAPGDVVTMKVLRDGQIIELNVELGER